MSYIEREALIQQMADNFRQGVWDGCDCGEYQIAETTILCAPAADVVEVVRCKDCKYGWTCIYQTSAPVLHCINAFGGKEVEPMGFCSCGEKWIALEDIVDIEKQTKKNNAAMQRVIDFVTEGNDETD